MKLQVNFIKDLEDFISWKVIGSILKHRSLNMIYSYTGWSKKVILPLTKQHFVIKEHLPIFFIGLSYRHVRYVRCKFFLVYHYIASTAQ